MSQPAMSPSPMSEPPRCRPRRPAIGLLVASAAVLAGCGIGSTPTDPAPQQPPPAPPAACLLDTAVFADGTGLAWTPDATTATDTRCVYDPSAPAGDDTAEEEGPAFVAVDIAQATADAEAQLDTVAQLCDTGSRAPVAAADGGLVCRFQGGSVFAAAVTGGRLVTVAASRVPAGTTAARLVVAFSRQLEMLGA